MSDSPLFDDGKDPGALRTIGEVAKALGIRQHVLRYWEEQFPTLRPLKRGGGRRYYRPDDIRLVETIDRLVHREGYTLKGARMALGSKGAPAPVSGTPVGVTPAAPRSAPAPSQGGVSRDRLIALRNTLATALKDA
ncbi:MerR-like DNA binding protein [Novosphingobium kunmingense]|uniref:MerR-like DNA binding protein n=1 Tax=Novosphingobium kunmingense TaxID=1211806 RepID=A0A2N0I1N9_9SPHN|nr:MerR family transcriptional regulator [Novosphingobium kunmingense]PKB25081.1 MerR-like DNA binding protein [Novosphingobium kunmingense]